MTAAKVLVVDDDPAIRRILSQTLELEDYEVSTAVDGVEALEMIADVLPDVVVLDVMMPRLDGFDVLRKIRHDPETSELPVILLTAKSSAEDTWEGWQEGVDYYMTKPFDIEELLRFLTYVLGGGHLKEGPEAH